MASRALECLEVKELPVFGEAAVVSGPVTTSLVCRAKDISPFPEVRIGNHSTSGNEDGNLCLGVGWALGLEAAFAFAAWVMWDFFHFLR